MIPARAPPAGWKAQQQQQSWGNQSSQDWGSGEDWGNESSQSWGSDSSWKPGNSAGKVVPGKVVPPKAGATPYAGSAGKSAGKSAASGAGWSAKQDEAKKRQEELKARREKEEQKRAQQQAALVVKKVIQRLRVASSDKFSAVVEELEKVQEEQMEAMGELVEEVTVEAQKAMEQAEKRFKAAEEKKAAEEQKKLEAQKRAEEKKKEEEKKAAEEKERLEGLVAEAEVSFEEAEAEAAKVAEAAAIFAEGADEASPQDIIDAAAATKEAAAAAKPVFEKVTATLKEKRGEVIKAKSKDGSELTAKLSDLQKKLITAQKSAATLQEKAEASSKKAARKASAMKRVQEQKDAFAKADTDKDGVLGIAEVLAFASSEYKFPLTGAAQDKIIGKLTSSEGGVPFDSFQQLRAMITIEKSILAAREKRAEQEKTEKLREETKASIKAKVEPVVKAFAEAEAVLLNAKKALKGFTPAVKQEQTSSQIFETAAEVQDQVDICQAKLDSGEALQKTIANAEEDAADELIGKFRKAETDKLTTQSKNIKSSLSKVVSTVRESKDKASRKLYSEMEKLRLLVTSCMLALLAAETKTSESLYSSSGGSDKGMSKEDFVTLLKSLSERLPAESVPEAVPKLALDESQVGMLFLHVAGEEVETIAQDRFAMLMTRHYYRVTKNTVMSEGEAIDGKSVRKLELAETLEALEAPKNTGEAMLARVRCRALRDGKEGWVTLEGNKGSVFLEGLGHFLTCTKETPLTDDLSVLNSKSIRKTAKGEHFQVLEFDTKDESCNLMRVKVMAMRDKAVGWVTLSSSEGAKFFEPC